MDKIQKLKRMLDAGVSKGQIAKKFNVNPHTINRWIEKHSLVIDIKHQCLCGEQDSKFFAYGRFSECNKCRSLRQTKLHNGYKKQAVEYKGGKCQRCGYDKCLASLDFHHIDPETKDPNWRKIRSRAFSFIKEELDKCLLVCRNCHGEIHDEIFKEKKRQLESIREVGRQKKEKESKRFCECGKIIKNKSKEICHNCYLLHKKKIDWPNKEELEKLVWEMPTTMIAKKLQVSDVAVCKMAKKYAIDKPPRGYWTKVRYGKV